MADKRLIDGNKAQARITSIAARLLETGNYEMAGAVGYVAEVIGEQPTVDAVEVVHGRWIHCQGKSNLWYCSECGEKILYNPTRRTYNIEKRPVHGVNKHCRGCGAIMDGGAEHGG